MENGKLEDNINENLELAKLNEYKKRSKQLEKARKRQFINAIILYISVALMMFGFFSINNPDILNILLNKVNTLLPMIIGLALLVYVLFSNMILNKENNLEEVDIKIESSNEVASKNLKDSDFISSNVNKVINTQVDQYNSQIEGAERKASILLNGGKFFVWFGIVFYIFSIIIWQLYLRNSQTTTGNLIGMFECTGVFIFLEVMAAWYLKQYRYYVDKSIYLIKVKAIFEKYLINYLLAEEDKFENIKYKDLFEYFSKEINWPKDNHLNKNKSDDIHESLLGIIKEFATSKKEQ